MPAEVYATVEETSSSAQAASADSDDANAGSAPMAAATCSPGYSNYSANPAAAPAAPAGSAPSAASTWSTTSGSADSALQATAGDPQQAEARTAEATASDSQQAEGVATWQPVQNEGRPASNGYINLCMSVYGAAELVYTVRFAEVCRGLVILVSHMMLCNLSLNRPSCACNCKILLSTFVVCCCNPTAPAQSLEQSAQHTVESNSAKPTTYFLQQPNHEPPAVLAILQVLTNKPSIIAPPLCLRC